MSLEWTAKHLISYPGGGSTPPKHQPFNPRPAGAQVPGSASEAVLQALEERYPAVLANHQVVTLVMAGGKWREGTVRWALVYLRTIGAIEVLGDEARNARYLKYRALPKRPARPRGDAKKGA